MNNYFFEKFGINDCYKDFTSNGNHFSLTGVEYRTIIKTFLTIYCYEIFFLKYPIYFLFGGKIVKNKIPAKVIRSKLKSQNNELISLKESVGFYWYDRPFKKFEEFTFKKLSGKTSKLQEIQKEWLKENDVSFLPTLHELNLKRFSR